MQSQRGQQLPGFIQFDSTIKLSGEEGAWEAFVAPPGVMVRGKTRDEIAGLASKAVDGMMLAFGKRPDFPGCLYTFLDARGVDYIVEPSASDMGEVDEQLVVRRRERVLA